MGQEYPKPLDELLIETTRAYLQDSSDTQRTFAENRLYPKLAEYGVRGPSTPAAARDADDYTRLVGNMQNTYSRVMNGTSQVPLAWLWPWVYALPGDYRTRMINEIRAQVPGILPSQSGGSVLADVGQLAKEAGEAITAAAALAADGKYDRNDRDYAPAALNELYDLRDQANAEIAAIERGTGITVPRSTSTH